MDLATRISEVAQGFSGKLGIAAINLTTGEHFHFNAGQEFPPASTIKLAVLYEVWKGALQGRWDLEDKLTLTRTNMVEGSGVLLDLTPGLQMTVRDVATLMIVVSDNTATNMLLDLCGIEPVNRSLAELGIDEVRLNRKIGLNMELPLGTVTPRAMAELLRLVATHGVLNQRACVEIIDILKRQKYKENTNRFIADTDCEDDTPTVRIGSKGGWIRGVRNDIAVVWAPRANYVLSMFSRESRDRRFYVDNEGSIALAKVSLAFYEAWGR